MARTQPPISDFYTVLQIPYSADATEVKKAFRRLSMVHHPDKTGGNDEEFKRIAAAYEVLGDQDKRKKYDEEQIAAATPGVRTAAPQREAKHTVYKEPESATEIIYPNLDAALDALDKAYEELYQVTNRAKTTYFFIVLDVIFNFPGKAAKIVTESIRVPSSADHEARRVREAAIKLAIAYDNAYHLEPIPALAIEGPAQPSLAALSSTAIVSLAENKAGTIRIIAAAEAKEAAARIGDKERAVDKRLDHLFDAYKDEGGSLKSISPAFRYMLPIYAKCTVALALTQIARLRKPDGTLRFPPGQEPKFSLAGHWLNPSKHFGDYGIQKESALILRYQHAPIALVVAPPSALPAIESAATPPAEEAKKQLQSLEHEMNKPGKEQMHQLITTIIGITKSYLRSTRDKEISKGITIVNAVRTSIEGYTGNPSQLYQQLSGEWATKEGSPVYQALNKVVSGVNWSAFGYGYDSTDIHQLRTAVERIDKHPKKDVDHDVSLKGPS